MLPSRSRPTQEAPEPEVPTAATPPILYIQRYPRRCRRCPPRSADRGRGPPRRCWCPPRSADHGRGPPSGVPHPSIPNAPHIHPLSSPSISPSPSLEVLVHRMTLSSESCLSRHRRGCAGKASLLVLAAVKEAELARLWLSGGGMRGRCARWHLAVSPAYGGGLRPAAAGS